MYIAPIYPKQPVFFFHCSLVFISRVDPIRNWRPCTKSIRLRLLQQPTFTRIFVQPVCGLKSARIFSFGQRFFFVVSVFPMSHTNIEAVPKLLDKKVLVPWNLMKSQMPRKKIRVVWAASLNVLLSRLRQGQVANLCSDVEPPVPKKKVLIHQMERHRTVSI